MMAVLLLVLLGTGAILSEAVRPIVISSDLRQGGEPREPPTWPDSYRVQYVFSMPNLFHTQPGGLSYPVDIWRDGPNHRQRIDVYNGTDTVLTLNHAEYTTYPRIDVKVCEVYKGHLGLGSPLPNLAKFQYAGQATMADGKFADIWQWQFREGDRTSQYTIYVSLAGAPLKFYMTGFNYETNSHFDEYLYDFTKFEPLSPEDDHVFEPPTVCMEDDKVHQRSEQAGRHPLTLRMAALLPGVRTMDVAQHAYMVFAHSNGRVHADELELQTRMDRYQEVVTAVQSHNSRKDVTYKRAVNRFADWTNEEFEAVFLPRRLLPDRETARLSGKPGYKAVAQFVVDANKKLPEAVDWRSTGADLGVKDQAMCGSCYAFSAVAAMQGAWYVATGQRRSFSEQQLVDCSWDYGYNSGCGGGDMSPCINYVVENGGIALEQEYQYQGIENYCRAKNYTRVGKFTGFVELPSRDERAVMQALHELGPLAVAVDAGPESFRFYDEGVWTDEECRVTPRSLDHAVIAFGYGTTAEGVDYWIVQNTWSKLYGEDGYIKIARGKGDCGISTQALTAVVDKKFFAPGVEERIAEAIRK